MAIDRSHLLYSYLDKSPSGGDMGYGGFEGMGIEPFQFDLQGGIENIPAQQIDFDKEKYYQSIVAPAEAARRDATTEAFQQTQALAAHTGRAPGEMESEVLAQSIRQAGETSAAGARAAEEAGLEVEKIEQADLTRRTQAAVAMGQLKEGAWAVLTKIRSDYVMMKRQQEHDFALLRARLSGEQALAEINRQSAYDIEMFKLNAGMQMLRYKEDSANLRAAAGLAMSERDAARMHSYRMEYLDRMSKIQSMNTIKDWIDLMGRRAQLTREQGPSPVMMGGGGNQPAVNYGMNWWDANPEQDYGAGWNPWYATTPP